LAHSILSRECSKLCQIIGKGFASAMSDSSPSNADTHSEAETAARAEAALKRMLAAPPKLHKDSKLGRRESRED
jgi:hypothetical protein